MYETAPAPSLLSGGLLTTTITAPAHGHYGDHQTQFTKPIHQRHTRLPLPTERAIIWLLGGVCLAAALHLCYLLIPDAGAAAENFVIVFVSIAVEALPFVLAGALVSGLLATAVPDRFFAALSRLPVQAQVPAALVGSVTFPVCECGSVPVARRLILRGVHPSAGVAFMLAAPILNPIVLGSTYVAYAGRDALTMTLGRAIIGATVAVVVSWAIFSFGKSTVTQITNRLEDRGCIGHDHGGEGKRSSLRDLSSHVCGDFLFMGKFVVAGSALAALVQTFISQDVIAPLADSAVLGGLAMMALGFLLSLCSEADAFLAVSFTGFSAASQLAFLVFGPVLDLKLALLYNATFGRAFVIGVAVISAPLTLVATLIFGAIT